MEGSDREPTDGSTVGSRGLGQAQGQDAAGGAAVELEPVDYLVVGAGAMGLAFVDTLLAEQPGATAAVIDARARPGGHWVDSYSFVRLHQPAAYYGVASAKLEPAGNPAELTAGPEVQRYFERALARLVATGRCRYFPNCAYQRSAAPPAAGQVARFRANDGATTYRIRVDRKLVDAAYLTAVTPSTRPPPFAVEVPARVISVAGLADLSQLTPRPQRFVVAGGGKTGMDAVLHLLGSGVEQRAITWVVPNDALLFDRDALLFDTSPDWSGVLGIPGPFHVLDETQGLPRKFRCAIVSRSELATLRTVENVVRLGRVVRARGGTLELERGRIELGDGALLVDCTGDGLPHRAETPVFSGSKITLQSVVLCQQAFSAAIIAHVECMGQTSDDEQKNALCGPLPHPNALEHFGPGYETDQRNRARLYAAMGEWMRSCRLNNENHDLRGLGGQPRARL